MSLNDELCPFPGAEENWVLCRESFHTGGDFMKTELGEGSDGVLEEETPERGLL